MWESSPSFPFPSLLDCIANPYPVQKYQVIGPNFLQRLWLGESQQQSQLIQSVGSSTMNKCVHGRGLMEGWGEIHKERWSGKYFRDFALMSSCLLPSRHSLRNSTQQGHCRTRKQTHSATDISKLKLPHLGVKTDSQKSLLKSPS